MTVGATLVASLLVTLARPGTWPLALASFLLRGGFLLVLAPIVVLPSAVGLANIVTPSLTTVVFRGLTPSITFVLAVVVSGTLAWLLGGGLLAAAAEAEDVRRVAADEDAWVGTRAPETLVPADHPAARVVMVRLIAHLPLLLGVSWGAIRIVTVAYRELSVPSDVAVPIVLRIAGSAPDAVGVIVATWLFGETVGGLASRRVILLGERAPRALGAALFRMLRHPLRCAVLAVVPLAPLVVVLVVVGIAGSTAWDALRASLSFGNDRLVTLGSLLGLVALFAGGLSLIAVVSAWRAAAWTVDLGGTFGVVGHGPVGQWNTDADSGSLGEFRP